MSAPFTRATVEEAFSPDYFAARETFRRRADEFGASLETLPVEARGPNGEELTVDVARLGPPDANNLLLLTSGLHGVEGFLGSAIQIGAFVYSGSVRLGTDVGVVLVHGLNAYGFAHSRRFDEANVDPNRNLLLPGEEYSGAPPGYAELDPLLSPPRPPGLVDTFFPRAVWAILWHGMPTLQQVVGGGQYEFPRGLFYGGSGPSGVRQLLDEHAPGWLGEATRVLHLDVHTGLGRPGEYTLMLESDDPRRFDWLARHYPPERLSRPGGDTVLYQARGSFGAWCQHAFADRDYTYVCAEFGTRSPISVVGALRRENQAHHHGEPNAASTRQAKRRLREAFCPTSPRWRERALSIGVDLYSLGLQALASPPTTSETSS